MAVRHNIDQLPAVIASVLLTPLQTVFSEIEDIDKKYDEKNNGQNYGIHAQRIHTDVGSCIRDSHTYLDFWNILPKKWG